MNEEQQKEVVLVYTRNIAPVKWIDWRFKMEGTPAYECLTESLFDMEADATRDLTSESVREAVVECVLRHENLFELVLGEAEDFIERMAEKDDEPDEEEEEWSVPADFTYKCGLKPGEKVRLVKDLPIENHKGEWMHTYPEGEVWTVLGPSSDPSVLWLRQANGKPHTWDDEESIFEQFARLE